MNNRFLKEFGWNAAVGVAVFGWIFSQAPGDIEPKPSKAALALSKTDGRGDSIPSVQQTKLNEISITIEQVELPSPDQEFGGQEPQGPLVKVTATSLKLRAQPTSRSSSLKVYPAGTTFERLGQDGDWLNVRHTLDGSSGWMHGDYLRRVSGT